MNAISKNQLELAIFLILGAALSRILPHPPNFAPIGAIALFSGAFLSKNSRLGSFLIPMLALWVSDLVLNNVVYKAYNPSWVWIQEGFYWTYGAFLLIIVLGIYLFQKNISAKLVVVGAFSSSLIFFLISNFGVWLGGSMYAHTAQGLAVCYAMAIPFYWNSLAGDLIYVGILFGAFALASKPFRWKAIS